MEQVNIMFNLFCIFLSLCCIVCAYKLHRKNAKLILENNKISYQKRSSEVRLGLTVENVAPFLDEWPYESNNFRFLGNPIDGVSFNEDEVVFVEIKTGASRLSKSQNKIKVLVEEGKVRFITFRVNEKGVSIK